MDPRNDPEEVQRRRDAVLERMRADGHLSRAQARRAAAEPLRLVEPRNEQPTRSHLLAAIRRELSEDPTLGPDTDQRAERLRTGGLEIHTTIDPKLQQWVDEAVAAAPGPAAAVAAAVAAVDPHTGGVRDGTGMPARVAGAEVLGKTDTSDRGADAWFVGGNTSLMAAVWVGDPQGRVTQPNASGATVAAPLWREAVGAALSDHSP